ncbi:hypothetical protein Tco_0144626 [Tanacetum coccineum]
MKNHRGSLWLERKGKQRRRFQDDKIVVRKREVMQEAEGSGDAIPSEKEYSIRSMSARCHRQREMVDE